jgi:hypothetical protein
MPADSAASLWSAIQNPAHGHKWCTRFSWDLSVWKVWSCGRIMKAGPWGSGSCTTATVCCEERAPELIWGLDTTRWIVAWLGRRTENNARPVMCIRVVYDCACCRRITLPGLLAVIMRSGFIPVSSLVQPRPDQTLRNPRWKTLPVSHSLITLQSGLSTTRSCSENFEKTQCRMNFCAPFIFPPILCHRARTHVVGCWCSFIIKRGTSAAGSGSWTLHCVSVKATADWSAFSACF